MKVLLVIGALSFGGAERVISNLANYFAQKGYEVILVAISKKDVSYPIDSRVEVINGIDRENEFDAILKLRKIIKKAKPEIVLSFLTHINIATIIALLGTGIPVVVSERNDPKNMPPEKFRKFLRSVVYPFANGLVFQTGQAKNYFNEYIQNKSMVIPNPIFLGMNPIEVEERKKEIISVGRLVPQKNHDQTIKAFSKLGDISKGYTLNIFGEGSQREYLQNLIKDLKMENRIFLHGETRELHDKMRNAEIFIMASEFEGMPNALMEAMALGLACISTDCPSGGPAFLIQNKENGILIPVGDEKGLINSMKELITNDSMRSRLANEAKHIYKQVNPSIVFNQWDEYLKSKAKKMK